MQKNKRVLTTLENLQISWDFIYIYVPVSYGTNSPFIGRRTTPPNEYFRLVFHGFSTLLPGEMSF